MAGGFRIAVGDINCRDLIEPFSSLEKSLLEVSSIAEAIRPNDFKSLFGPSKSNRRFVPGLTFAGQEKICRPAIEVDGILHQHCRHRVGGGAVLLQIVSRAN